MHALTPNARQLAQSLLCDDAFVRPRAFDPPRNVRCEKGIVEDEIGGADEVDVDGLGASDMTMMMSHGVRRCGASTTSAPRRRTDTGPVRNEYGDESYSN